MTEFTAAHFDEICDGEPVRGQIAGVELNRAKAVKTFWIIFGACVAVGVIAGIFLLNVNSALAFFVMIMGAIAGFLIGLNPVEKARKGLKQPMLEALAQRGSMTYTAANFQPPFYAGARKALFGSWLSEQTFTDLFQGADDQGRPFAFYEATLETGRGKSRQTVFTGQMYGFGAGHGSTDEIVITPDKGLFNFFKPGPGLQRVAFQEDPEFEKKFEVYSSNPGKAQSILTPPLRARLMELRGKGKFFAHIDGEAALVAITGPNRFEPGSMFKAVDGKQRARLMFDDVCASTAVLREMRAALG